MFAELTDGVVTNIVVCEDRDFAASQGWSPIGHVTPTPGIGWTFDGDKWKPPADVETADSPAVVSIDQGAIAALLEQTAAATNVAEIRNALLGTLSQLLDVPPAETVDRKSSAAAAAHQPQKGQ